MLSKIQHRSILNVYKSLISSIYRRILMLQRHKALPKRMIMTIGDRIKVLRKEQKLTQSDLAAKVDLSYIQIGRYEQQKSKPSSDVVRRLADALGTTADFLMNGDSQTVAATRVTDRELLDLFAAVEQLDTSDQTMVKTFIDALVTKRRVQELA